MDIKNKIKFYSKKGCFPCDWAYQLFEARFKEDYIEKIIFDTDEEALKEIEKYNTKSVPFIVIGNSVIHSKDVFSFLYAMNVCSENSLT